MRRTAFLLVALGLTAAAPAPAAGASASPVASSAVSMGFKLPNSRNGINLNAAADCISLDGGWAPFGDGNFVGTSFKPRGLLDVGARSGEVIVPGQAIHIERIFVHPSRAVGVVDMGLQLAGRRAYLTGVLRRVRATSARSAPRRRLVLLSGVKISSRANRGHLLVTVHARASMLRSLASTLERTRCKGPRESGKPIRTGESMGRFTAAIDPARAIATAGSLRIGISLLGTTPSVPTVEPTGGAQPGSDGLRFAWAPGTRAPAACSDVCVPDRGTLPLVGGFDLVQGAQRLSFSDLAIAPAGSQYTVSATVAGVRRTVATGYIPAALAFTPELDALLASTFGDPALSGHLLNPTFAPTQLAPA